MCVCSLCVHTHAFVEDQVSAIYALRRNKWIQTLFNLDKQKMNNICSQQALLTAVCLDIEWYFG